MLDSKKCYPSPTNSEKCPPPPKIRFCSLIAIYYRPLFWLFCSILTLMWRGFLIYFGIFPPYYRVLFRSIINVILRIFPRLKKKNIKNTLIIGQKSRKIGDNKARFELKIAYIQVFQGKQNQNHISYRSKKSKKYSIIMLKNAEKYKKPLKITIIIGLKSQRSDR